MDISRLAELSFQKCSICCRVSDMTECMCTYCTHLRTRRLRKEHHTTYQLFIHCKLIRASRFVRQGTGIAVLPAARSPFQECQPSTLSQCLSRVLQTEPPFMFICRFMKPLQTNPPQLRSCSPPLIARSSSCVPGKGVGIGYNYWLHM